MKRPKQQKNLILQLEELDKKYWRRNGGSKYTGITSTNTGKSGPTKIKKENTNKKM